MKLKKAAAIIAWASLLWVVNEEYITAANISNNNSEKIKKILNTNSETQIHYKTDMLNIQEKKNISKILHWYCAFYNIKLPYLYIVKGETVPGDNLRESTLAIWEPQKILIHEELLKNATKEIKESTFIHEIFHAIKPEKADAITPYVLKDGYTMTWVQGLSIIVNKWADFTKFGVLEEAAAQACAAKYKPDYRCSDIHYMHIGSFVLKMIRKGWINTQDIIQAQTTNNIHTLIAKIMNKNQVEGKDIETIMETLNTIYTNEQDLSDLYVKHIEELRK